MKANDRYIEEIKRLIEKVQLQKEEIERASQLVVDALTTNGYVFTFGTGHSHILAEEIFYRAGGLARVCPILENNLMLHAGAARSSILERMSGYAKPILDDVDAVKEGGVMFLFSNSGCNTVAVEMAQEAKARGLSTVCVTNITHSKKATSRHPKGKKLMEVCDVVIDNMGCYGDSAIDVNGYVTGPTSTVIGAMIMQEIVCRAIEIISDSGKDVEIFTSANTAGNGQANEVYIEKYKPVIKAL